MIRKQYVKALDWLDRSEQLIQQEKLPERERLRHQVFICYYRAEICYREEKYDLAKSHFYTVLEQGNEIGWQRFVNYAQNWLADIAIVQGDLQKAAYLLETGLTTAQDSKERRRVAHFQASYARLEEARAKYAEACKWAKQALEFFIRDGMQEDAEVMQSLLEKLA